MNLTLDPKNWDEFRAFAHRAVDDMVEHLSTLDSQPAWQPAPQAIRNEIAGEGVPFEGQPLEHVYEQFLRCVLPYANGNRHPRFWGWVQGNGTPLGMIADMLASGMNAHVAGFNQTPALVEEQVIAWLAELLGMPGSSGLLVTGGSMASILGLAVARHAKAGWDVRAHGLQGERQRLRVYASVETHGWIDKGVELLGLGRDALVRIPVDAAYRMDTERLARAIREDRERGLRPICIVGNAGTINTGATDNLHAVADLAAAENVWLHVDGAFGALAKISPKYREVVDGLERADSVALDLHKWMYLPFDCACLLVRDPEMHTAAFASTPAYLAPASRGLMAGGLPFADRGVDLTRSFKALKVWMSLKTHGVDAFAALVEQNIEQAHALARAIERHPSLELLAPVELNVVCFRYVAPELKQAQLDALNAELLVVVQERGVVIPSGTTLNGSVALRCAIVNHRSKDRDFEALLQAVTQAGDELRDTCSLPYSRGLDR